MVLANQTRWPAMHGLLLDQEGIPQIVVVIRQTFHLGGGAAMALQPVKLAPEWFQSPSASSLRYDSDLTLRKAGTDVVLHASAYARSSEPVTSVLAGFALGPLRKILRVWGDRVWHATEKELRITAPVPFRTMPITWERAYGGEDAGVAHPINPIGIGFSIAGRELNGLRLPNVEDPQRPLLRWSDRPAPVGFGPLDPLHPPRRTWMGTYDDAWRATRMPLPPTDHDQRALQCAPEDQQVPGFLKGGEDLSLYNLSPRTDLTLRLPSLDCRVEFRATGAPRTLPMVLHTVCVEPDDNRISLTWHGQLVHPTPLTGEESLLLSPTSAVR